ncbi:MAG: tyrosine-type recombinase/integrase [Synechococcales cyanobacterium CRU_2_2]|nr:tyrosine-type recombinase/integrase [Synechococcales cyanobacterium CRU_2_2]
MSSLTPKSCATQLHQINQRLKLAQMGVQLELRGQMLALRGTLPPKPGSSKTQPHQQRISLKLPATAAGLKQAEREAKVVAAQIITETFDWEKYRIWQGRERLDGEAIAQQIWAFETKFFQQRQDNLASAQSTWDGTYAPYLRKLASVAQSSRKLSLAEAFCTTLESLPNHARSRQICCTALVAFAEFLKLELPENFKQLGGTYSPSKVKRRDLPNDDAILAAYEQIGNPAWKFVYGMMATYGLRNHEVFFCDYSRLKLRAPDGKTHTTVEVLDTTKTGEHEVWPFYPEWIDRFDLRNVRLPPVNTDLSQTTLQRVGQQVTRQFKRYGVPFSPYDLRHAWAVRTIHFGIPDTVAAKMMGHSVAIHTRTYHKWITRRDQQSAVEAAMRRYQG